MRGASVFWDFDLDPEYTFQKPTQVSRHMGSLVHKQRDKASPQEALSYSPRSFHIRKKISLRPDPQALLFTRNKYCRKCKQVCDNVN